MKALTALIGLCSFFLLVQFVQWAWPHLCDAAFLAVFLGGLLFSCPWVILGGLVVWFLWCNHKKEEAKRAAEAAREKREERRIERLQESLDRLEAAKAKPKPRKHAEHSGAEGSVWGRN
jgi:chromate transport protein ChrA